MFGMKPWNGVCPVKHLEVIKCFTKKKLDFPHQNRCSKNVSLQNPMSCDFIIDVSKKKVCFAVLPTKQRRGKISISPVMHITTAAAEKAVAREPETMFRPTSAQCQQLSFSKIPEGGAKSWSEKFIEKSGCFSAKHRDLFFEKKKRCQAAVTISMKVPAASCSK